VLLLVYALWYMQISNATRDGLKETALAVARTMAEPIIELSGCE
jgi:two-component system sensor histidine kinase DcuS